MVSCLYKDCGRTLWRHIHNVLLSGPIRITKQCVLYDLILLNLVVFSHEFVSNSFAAPWTVCSLPGSYVHGISQAKILEWVPFSSPRDLPGPEVETASPIAGRFFTIEPQGKFLLNIYTDKKAWKIYLKFPYDDQTSGIMIFPCFVYLYFLDYPLGIQVAFVVRKKEVTNKFLKQNKNIKFYT